MLTITFIQKYILKGLKYFNIADLCLMILKLEQSTVLCVLCWYLNTTKWEQTSSRNFKPEIDANKGRDIGAPAPPDIFYVNLLLFIYCVFTIDLQHLHQCYWKLPVTLTYTILVDNCSSHFLFNLGNWHSSQNVKYYNISC